MRGEREKQELTEKASEVTNNEIEINDISSYKPRKVTPPTRQKYIKKVWQVDLLRCQKCKGEMKIISLINEQSVIWKILEHLNLWSTEEQVVGCVSRTMTRHDSPNRTHDRYYHPLPVIPCVSETVHRMYPTKSYPAIE